MGVLQPLKVTLTNWPEGQVEWIDAPYFADEPQRGTRPVPLGRDLLTPQPTEGALASPSIEAVGNYAIRIVWRDGHSTGIYPFQYLRDICPCPACRSTDASRTPASASDFSTRSDSSVLRPSTSPPDGEVGTCSIVTTRSWRPAALASSAAQASARSAPSDPS